MLRRPVGEPEVWREQLAHLRESSKLEHVELRVVPFSAGPHPGMLGSFAMMQFLEEEAFAFVCVEHERGAICQGEPGDIDRFTVVVAELGRLALSSAEHASRWASPPTTARSRLPRKPAARTGTPWRSAVLRSRRSSTR